MSPLLCAHAGCRGPIGADGACDDCGRAPKGSSLLAQVSADNAGASARAPDGATSSFPSSRAVASSYPSARAATMAFPSSMSGAVGSAKKLPADAHRSARAESRRLGSRSSRASKGSSSRRRSLGGGLVNLPPVASHDPSKLVMAHAEVPPSKRRCPHCDHKVNRLSGFCPHCGKEYNFLPSLSAGDVVAGKFEVKGPIAFGGLGWIYLGWDTSLSRWVVLKGLLNAKDEAAAAAAVTERRFLAAVKHPKIVGIHDFIQHGSEGFIVMEFVGGDTIDSLRRANDIVDAYAAGSDPATRKPLLAGKKRSEIDNGAGLYELETLRRGTLPIEEACAYILGILPAFGHLHEQGVVYCDFKPENFMIEGDEVKLIDMGGARRIGDPDGDIFGTRGFMAPEASEDPIAVSDLYSIGRSLAVLTMDFKHQTEFENSLPAPSSQPLLAQFESFQRFLLRSTHPDPDERFQSAAEMAEQLHGVLREIASLSAPPQHFDSKSFGPDNLMFADDLPALAGPLARALPSLRIDPQDKRAAEAARIAAIPRADARLEALIRAAGDIASPRPLASPEACLRLAEAYAEKGSFGEAHGILDKLQADDPFDWKVQWERGKAHLNAGHAQAAAAEFERVCFEMPGELAPKLGRAFALEMAANHAASAALYDLVARVDPRVASACFGLARCRLALGDIQGAAAALRRVPEGHSLRGASRLRLAKALAEAKQATWETLSQAASAIEEAFSEGGAARQLAGVVLLRAAMMAKGAPSRPSAPSILGSRPEESPLRCAAEAQFRAAARMAGTHAEKIHWIDMANRARPHTLF